jgi:hypothetical protein
VAFFHGASSGDPSIFGALVTFEATTFCADWTGTEYREKQIKEIIKIRKLCAMVTSHFSTNLLLFSFFLTQKSIYINVGKSKAVR